MADRVQVGGLSIAAELDALVRNEIAPGTGVDADGFWAALEVIVADLGPENRELLAARDHIQEQIDARADS